MYVRIWIIFQIDYVLGTKPIFGTISKSLCLISCSRGSQNFQDEPLKTNLIQSTFCTEDLTKTQGKLSLPLWEPLY